MKHSLKKRLALLVAALLVIASVPFPAMAAEAKPVYVIFNNAQSVGLSGNTAAIVYNDGLGFSVTGIPAGSEISGRELRMSVTEDCSLTITLTGGAGGTSYETYVSGSRQEIASGGSFILPVVYENLQSNTTILQVDQPAAQQGGGGQNQNVKRRLTATVADSCRFLTAKSGYQFSISDCKDVEVKTTNAYSVTTDAFPGQAGGDGVPVRCVIGLQLIRDYFFPTFRVVVEYAGGDTVTLTEDTWDIGQGFIGVEINPADGDNAVNITVYPQIDKTKDATIGSGTDINGGEIQYTLVDTDGNVQIADNAAVVLNVNDKADDSAAFSLYGDDFVSTLDISMSVNGSTVSELESEATITLSLDTSAYTSSQYTVVRNHNGTVEELETYYDAASGTISFVTDKFSDYSLISRASSSSSQGNGSAGSASDNGYLTDIARTADAIRAAAGGAGQKTIFFGKGEALPDTLMKALANTSDVTLVFEYTYEGVVWNTSITAAAAKLVADSNIPWYGPLYLRTYFPTVRAGEGTGPDGFTNRYPVTDDTGLPVSAGRYTVKRGDTLCRIAMNNHMSLAQLLSLNPQIANPNLIYPGQIINL